MYKWEPTFQSLGDPIPKQVCLGWQEKEIEVWLLLSSKCAVVCSYSKSHQHLDAKIVNISHRHVWVVSIGMYKWEPTFESLGEPIPKQVCLGWQKKEIEEGLLLSSMCAVVCSYCMSHQHLDAKIVNISPRDVWVVSRRNVWVGTYF